MVDVDGEVAVFVLTKRWTCEMSCALDASLGNQS
jgi:hypothetical protein